MNFIKKAIKSYLLFFIIIGISSIIYTSILYFSNLPLEIKQLNKISIIIVVLIFFINGVYISKSFKQKGLMNSFSISLILLITIIIYKLITKTFDSQFLIKAACCLFAASLGGILGVNIKK